MRRAELGIDGNCGFAGIGHLAESPDWEFVEIEGEVTDRDNQARAAAKAYRKLKARLAPEEISYFIGESHPRYCG